MVVACIVECVKMRRRQQRAARQQAICVRERCTRASLPFWRWVMLLLAAVAGDVLCWRVSVGNMLDVSACI